MAELPDKITLEIVTPERELGAEQVDEVRLPGREGQLGVLPGHAPLLTELGTGLMSYRVGGEVSYLSIINGYAEVLPDRVIVLADIGERAEEIDVARAEKAKQWAEEQLASKDPEVNWYDAAAARERALARLEAAAKAGTPVGQSERS